MAEPHADFGYVRAKVETLERDVTEVKSDVKDMKKILEQSKGGLRVITGIAAIAAALGTALGAFFGKHS